MSSGFEGVYVCLCIKLPVLLASPVTGPNDFGRQFASKEAEPQNSWASNQNVKPINAPETQCEEHERPR